LKVIEGAIILNEPLLVIPFEEKLDDCVSLDNDNETTAWVEYWLDGELVHRSAHVALKQAPSIAVEAASLT
jgi:hypothetical protein